MDTTMAFVYILINILHYRSMVQVVVVVPVIPPTTPAPTVLAQSTPASTALSTPVWASDALESPPEVDAILGCVFGGGSLETSG